MAKYFHRLPNGDFQMFDSYEEYLQDLKRKERKESCPIITMIVVGVLFIMGAIWQWDAAALASGLFSLQHGLFLLVATKAIYSESSCSS